MMENEIFTETIIEKIKEEPIEDYVDIDHWEFRNGEIRQEDNSIELINSLHDIADLNYFLNYELGEHHKSNILERDIGEHDTQIEQENENHIDEKDKEDCEDLALEQEHVDLEYEDEQTNIDITNPNESKFKCEICNKTFNFKHYLHVHKRVIHDKKLYECEICHNKFRWRYILNRHVEAVHNKIKFECTICHREFKLKHSLATHMKAIHRRLTYECVVCNKVYRYKRMLDSHMKAIHHGIKYKCTVCHETSSQRHCHDENVTPIYDLIKYKCKICNMSFRLGENLDIHLKVIHDEINMCEKP